MKMNFSFSLRPTDEIHFYLGIKVLQGCHKIFFKELEIFLLVCKYQVFLFTRCLIPQRCIVPKTHTHLYTHISCTWHTGIMSTMFTSIITFKQTHVVILSECQIPHGTFLVWLRPPGSKLMDQNRVNIIQHLKHSRELRFLRFPQRYYSLFK